MQSNDKGSVCLWTGREVVLDETMMERTISVKTELLSSSEMTESMEMVSDESKESEDGSSALPRGMELDSRGMELDCSSCLLQEQMKEGNYELVSKVAILLFVSIIDLASSNLVF